MKSILAMILIIFSFSTLGAPLTKKEKISALKSSKKHYKKRNFFSALDLIAKRYIYETPSKEVKNYIEKLVKFTGTYYFNTYSDLQLRKLNIPTTDLIMGKRNLYLKKYKYAFRRLKRIPEGHRFHPESLLVRGTIYHKLKMYKKAVKTFKQCSLASHTWRNKSTSKQERYFAIIGETCVINIARIFYKKNIHKKASRLYGIIPKSSYKWPYTLIERAWSHYNLEEYNRSLGIIMTYDSPLLQSYFMPEAEVLKALNYYKMCLYEDSLKVIDNYYKVYKPRSEKLKAIIAKQNSSELYFFNLMFSPISDSEKENKFLRNIITQIRKRVKYNLDLSTLLAINKEIFRASEDSNSKLVLKMQRDIKEQINHYIKVSMYKFINEIHKLSSELFNLKLEILSQQRELVYKNTALKKDRSRGNAENIKRLGNQEYWSFKNAFWADELGDYSFALTSMCKKQKVKRYED